MRIATGFAAAVGVLAVWALAALVPAPARAADTDAVPLTPEEERGKQIYLEGKSPGGGKIHARVGRSRVKVPAGAVPCGNCHGADGLGRPEGGVEPPNVTWSNLTKGYGHRHPHGRAHPPFDEGSLASAIRVGLDPAYNELDFTMPLYEMSDADMAALIAYLKRLEGDLGPGVSDAAIRIGTLVPGPGSLEDFGATVTGMLEAYFATINDAGGIYGRRIEVAVAERTDSQEDTLANLRRLVDEESVFAIVGGFAAGMERDVFDILERRGVPNVGPITLLPVPPGFADGGAFLMAAGLAEQARALVAFAVGMAEARSGPIAIVHAGLPDVESVVRAVRREGARHGLREPRAASIAGGMEAVERLVADLSDSDVGAVLYVGPDDGLRALAQAAAETSWRPLVLASGPLNGRAALDLPPVFNGKVFLAYPTLPSDQSAAGADELRRLQAAHGLERHHPSTQISALVAAKVLVEGLRRAGKAVSRAKLVSALESLSKFDNGLIPPISFGPARHVGAYGAHVIAIDLDRRAFASTATWVRLD